MLSKDNECDGGEKTGVTCQRCKKEIKTEAQKYVQCEKMFHPSCVKIHKVYNSTNELIPCKGKIEVFAVKASESESGKTSGNSRERKISNIEGGRAAGSNIDSRIEVIYKMVKEMKNEMLGKDLIKKVITEVIDEEMDRVRVEIQNWKEAELESVVRSVIKSEIGKIADILPMMGISMHEVRKKKSYSEAASNKQEAVLIVKPIEENKVSSSEDTKRDIKKKF